MNVRIRALVSLVLLTLIPSLAGAAEPVVELPTLGGTEAQAYGINDLRQIVGWSELAGGSVEATIWNGETPTSLGLPAGARFSFAHAVNNHGEVAGYSEIGTIPGDPSNPKSAVFWGASSIVDIGAEMEFDRSIAFDINDNGVVALQGDSPQPFGLTAGWVWNETFGGTQAGADPIYRFGGNYGINNLNDVVGDAAVGFDGQQAILARFNGLGWDVGVEIGPQAVRSPARANAISEGGVIVGQAGDDGVHVHEAAIFTLDRDRPVEWLDKLEDFFDSNALAVNDDGLIVGDGVQFTDFGPERRAVVWIDGQIYDLNHLLRPTSRFRILISATGVNAAGDVVGYGQLRSGEMRPFVIYELRRGPSSALTGHPGEPARLR